jgi:hypothetical protein
MALPISGTINDNQAGILRPRKTATPLIINGDMAIAQRGTSKTGLTASGTGYHTIDRFMSLLSSAGTWTDTQDTDVPTGQGFVSSFKTDCTTADASLSAGDFRLLQIRNEGQNFQVLKHGTSDAESVTVAFWVKSNKTGTYTLELEKADSNRSISQTYTIDSANTWEKKVLSFAGDTSATIPNDNSNEFTIGFWLGAGTDWTSGTMNTSWATKTSANRVSSSQTNLADSTSNYINITGVQLEVGSFDTNSIPDFQFEDRATSLNRCHRYFYRVYSNNPYSVFSAGYSSSSTKHLSCFNFPTTMRALPTCSSNGSFQVIEGGSSRSVTGVAFDGNSRSLDNARIDVSMSGGTTGNGGMFRAANDTDAYIEADAEL